MVNYSPVPRWLLVNGQRKIEPMAFDLFEIIQKLGATPKELRDIADQLERSHLIVVSEKTKIYNSYKKKFIELLENKRDGRR